MAGPLVGGAFLSAFLQVAFDRLATHEVMGFVRQWDIDMDEVENLKWNSATIEALIDDAEVKQFTNPVVKLWLDRLKQLLYDAEDILDEYATEIHRVKLESESQTHPDRQVRNPVSLTPSSSETSVLSSLNSGIESVVKGIFNQTLDEIKVIPHKVYDIYEELHRIKEYGSKVKQINDKLEGAAQKGSDLGLGSSTGAGSSRPKVSSQRRLTSSLVNRDEVFGREKDKEKIMELLLRDEPTHNNFSVLTIVGMGGLGKTTLAKLVYDAMNCFDLKAWVCVTEEFDIVRTTKEILESITGRQPNSDILDRLQNELQVALSEKKFLLVLDDVWNRNYSEWGILKTPFASGARGSKVLVTTRDDKVSSIMRDVTAHRLEHLSNEDCVLLLKRHAFIDGNSLDIDRKLEMFGHKVAEKCKGLPLAVKTIAGLLRDRIENGEWKAVLENEIWDLEEGESEILPSLMLSYHHLPLHLKRCFAYCALFPKDFEFDKIELVRLWMAEGIVQSKGTKRFEDIGVEYFDDLFMRSFFEQSNRSSKYESLSLSNWACYDELFWIYLPYDRTDYFFRETYQSELYDGLSERLAIKSFSESSNISRSSKFVMHDLIHDLAQFVSGKIYCRREQGDKPSKITTRTRHMSFNIGRCDINVVTFFSDIKDMKSLRTLLEYNHGGYGGFSIPEAVFPTTHQFLRVLCLVGSSLDRDLSPSIGNLKHLRLLDLSYSNIVRLPDSMRSLYNLQTLILSGCNSLRELPKDMGDLVSLRHLFLPNSWKQKLPMRFGCLTNLQTLTKFNVGLHTSDSGGIGELRNLSQLRGKLKFSNLENIGNNGAEDMEAILKNKPHLFDLRLSWSDYGSKDSFPDSRDEKVEKNVLDQLQPHTNLEMLWIDSYGGTRFPSWVGQPSFTKLATVILSGCHKCILLSSLGQLPSLKYLKINGCSAIKIAGSELCGDGSLVNKQFRSLETLMIQEMTEWEEWSEVVEEEQVGEEFFPCLHKLSIRGCPKLMRLSHCFSSLMILRIVKCNELRELPRFLPSLQELEIVRCEKLAVLSGLPSIQKLALVACDQMTTLSKSQSPSSSSSSPHVCYSRVEGDRDGNGSEGEFRCLRELYIIQCPNMRQLPHALPSLVKLWIEPCEELSFLPMLPSIKELKLGKCNEMVVGKVSNLSSLSFLYVEGISSNLSPLPGGFFKHLTALERLEIHSFSELTVALQHHTSLRNLVIDKCPKLVSFPDDDDQVDGEGLLLPSSLEYLKLSYCDNIKKLPQSLCNLHCLKELSIEGARELTCLLEGLNKLASLHTMRISDCPSLVSVPNIDFPTALWKVSIRNCGKLNSLPKGLHKLTSLQELYIDGCPTLQSFPDIDLPTALWVVSIRNCGKLSSLPKGLHELSNLKELEIVECSFLLECKNLEALHTLGLQNFTSLSKLTIGGCRALVSIPKGLLPTNLRSFGIKDCPILESLHDGLSDLTSLKWLYIRNCPILKHRYQKKEGKDELFKIAQFADIYINGVRLCSHHKNPGVEYKQMLSIIQKHNESRYAQPILNEQKRLRKPHQIGAYKAPGLDAMPG